MRARTLRSALAGGAWAAAGAARQRDVAAGTAGWLPQSGLAVLAAAVLVAMATPVIAQTQTQAQTQAERVPFNIPAQPLVSALRAFAGQGKQQLLFDEDKLARFQAQATRPARRWTRCSRAPVSW
jgi:aminopeptidase N